MKYEDDPIDVDLRDAIIRSRKAEMAARKPAKRKRGAVVRVGTGDGLGIAVTKWKRAERRYQRDCNVRWHLKRPDLKRRFLAKAASVAYQKLVRAIKKLARPNVADEPRH